MHSVLLGLVLNPGLLAGACYSGSSYDQPLIDKLMLAVKKSSLMRENKID